MLVSSLSLLDLSFHSKKIRVRAIRWSKATLAGVVTDTIDRLLENHRNTGNLREAASYSIVMVSWKTTSTMLAAEARDYWPRG